MRVTSKIKIEGRISSFANAEEEEVLYYASLDRNESVEIVEKIRKMIWDKEYLHPMTKEIRWANLKEDRDEFE